MQDTAGYRALHSPVEKGEVVRLLLEVKKMGKKHFMSGGVRKGFVEAEGT